MMCSYVSIFHCLLGNRLFSTEHLKIHDCPLINADVADGSLQNVVRERVGGDYACTGIHSGKAPELAMTVLRAFW